MVGEVVRDRAISRAGRAVSAALLVALAAGAIGCATASTNDRSTAPAAPVAPAPAPARPLADAERSPEMLGRRVLAAIVASDEAMLTRYRLTKDEFARFVWPEQPASKLNNVTVDFAWDQASLTSLAGLREILNNHGGRRYDLLEIRFQGVDDYPTYRVHKKPIAVVRDETGAVRELRLFGSMLELDGQFKLFGYAVK